MCRYLCCLGTTLAAVLLLATAPAGAQSDERVLSFHSAIQIQTDASMYVTETIKVRALGKEIKRGIYREFPTKYEDVKGKVYRVGFKVLEVKRDGNPEPYHLKRISNGKAVYVGDKNVFLKPGEYTYTLTYKTDRQLGFFDDHDELYWNVNGLDWGFPFDEISATVVLPAEVPDEQMKLSAYTGPRGAKGQDFTAQTDGRGRADFVTTKALGPHQGMTIVVEFPKGIVTPPSTTDVALSILKGSGPAAIFFGLWAALVLYYLAVWIALGRDPGKGQVLPQAAPPEGFSPAALRYISRMRFDDKVFAVALVNMAVKGYVRIDEAGGKFIVQRDWAEEDVLTEPERELANGLFSEAQAVVLQTENHRIVGAAKAALQRALRKQHARKYFIENRLFGGIGCLTSLGILGVAIYLAKQQDVWIIAVVSSVVLLIAVNGIFHFLLRKPTALGRRLLDEVAGFNMMLKGEAHGEGYPEKTAGLFEMYLPFAIALGHDDVWSNQFAKALARQPDYQPRWYHGRRYDRFDAGRFSSDLSDSFSSAVSSASKAPGSSSGGGGGGSSGGGGGGGGGGGW